LNFLDLTEKNGLSGTEMTGYRITPIFAETSVGDADANGCLAALVFVDANQSRHFFHIR
jgi:hypothetical protein